jgi:hypothetical protein
VPYEGSLFGLVGVHGAVLAYGLRGTALRSADRGATWRRVETGVEDAIVGATATPEGGAVLVTQAGQVLVTDDGASFRRGGPAAAPPASCVAAAGGGRFVVGGPAGLRVEALEDASRRAAR